MMAAAAENYQDNEGSLPYLCIGRHDAPLAPRREFHSHVSFCEVRVDILDDFMRPPRRSKLWMNTLSA